MLCTEGDVLDVILGRYNHGQPNLGVFLCGHAGDEVTIDRRGREPILLRRPTLSMGLLVQPEAVRGLLASRAARGRGFVARFLVSAPKSLLGGREIHPHAIPEKLRARYRAAIHFLLDVPIDEGRGPEIEVDLGTEGGDQERGQSQAAEGGGERRQGSSGPSGG